MLDRMGVPLTHAIIVQVAEVQDSAKAGEAAVPAEGAEQGRWHIRQQLVYPCVPSLVQGHGQESHLGPVI